MLIFQIRRTYMAQYDRGFAGLLPPAGKERLLVVASGSEGDPNVLAMAPCYKGFSGRQHLTSVTQSIGRAFVRFGKPTSPKTA